MFAQVGDYHGFIGTSWPTGMPKSGRHASLTHSIRTPDMSYVLDPDNGDEAYDLSQDPRELMNLRKNTASPPPDQLDTLKNRLLRFVAECNDLRQRLGVIPGDRGFVEGWE